MATDAKITNNSVGPVKVVDCEMSLLNRWTITENPSKAKVGAKEFNFTLNDKAFGSDGSYDASDWSSINAEDSLPLVYSSEVAPQKNAINEAIANVIFTVDWDENIVKPITPAKNTRFIDKDKMPSALKKLTGNITIRNSTEVPANYDSMVDVSEAQDGSVMAYVTGQDVIVQTDGGVFAPENASDMFNSYIANSIDLKGLDTSNTTDMSYMFVNCVALTSLDLSSFDTSKILYMSEIFRNCSSLTTVYAHTQVDADNMNSSSRKPENVNVIVK